MRLPSGRADKGSFWIPMNPPCYLYKDPMGEILWPSQAFLAHLHSLLADLSLAQQLVLQKIVGRQLVPPLHPPKNIHESLKYKLPSCFICIIIYACLFLVCSKPVPLLLDPMFVCSLIEQRDLTYSPLQDSYLCLNYSV